MCFGRSQHGNGGWQPRSPGGRQPGWGSPGWPRSRRKFVDVRSGDPRPAARPARAWREALRGGGAVAWFDWVFRRLGEHQPSCRWRRLVEYVRG